MQCCPKCIIVNLSDTLRQNDGFKRGTIAERIIEDSLRAFRQDDGFKVSAVCEHIVFNPINAAGNNNLGQRLAAAERAPVNRGYTFRDGDAFKGGTSIESIGIDGFECVRKNDLSQSIIAGKCLAGNDLHSVGHGVLSLVRQIQVQLAVVRRQQNIIFCLERSVLCCDSDGSQAVALAEGVFTDVGYICRDVKIGQIIAFVEAYS